MSTKTKPDGYGALKSRRQEAARAAAKAKAVVAAPVTLSAPYPFPVVPFDPKFFRL